MMTILIIQKYAGRGYEMMVNGNVPKTVWSDSTIKAGITKIRTVHVSELRAAIQNLQNLTPSVQNCGYNACQSCQSSTCQSQTCQSYYCQSCQTCESECWINDCGGSCFIAGTLILMEDFSWKPVEQLAAGDRVRGLTRVNTVIAPYSNILGNSRSIMTFTDRSLSWSGEHLLWVKIDDDEFFGTCDFNHHLREKNAERFPEFKGYTLSEREAIIISEPVDFAYLTGWKRDEPIVDRRYGDFTPVHTAILDGDHTMIANGYVVGGFAHDDDFDYSEVHWNGLVDSNV